MPLKRQIVIWKETAVVGQIVMEWVQLIWILLCFHIMPFKISTAKNLIEARVSPESEDGTQISSQSYWWRWCERRWSRSWLRGPGARQRLTAGFSPLLRTASRASVAGWDDPVQSALCPHLWPVVEDPRQQSPSCWSRRRPARQTRLRSENVYCAEEQ